MRILARTAIAFSAAIFAANYLLPQSWLLYAAVLSALMAAGLIAVFYFALRLSDKRKNG